MSKNIVKINITNGASYTVPSGKVAEVMVTRWVASTYPITSSNIQYKLYGKLVIGVQPSNSACLRASSDTIWTNSSGSATTLGSVFQWPKKLYLTEGQTITTGNSATFIGIAIEETAGIQ